MKACGVLYFSINNMTNINEKYGKEEGDNPKIGSRKYSSSESKCSCLSCREMSLLPLHVTIRKMKCASLLIFGLNVGIL